MEAQANPFKAMHQAERARKLVNASDDIARRLGVDPVTQEYVEATARQSTAWWRALGDVAGAQNPSDETVALAISQMREREWKRFRTDELLHKHEDADFGGED